jgi:cellulose synthase/poly-beta-1,6-N-acetylglucosamine synthase-like glycosyltransferase
MRTVSIVSPCYNEEANLESYIEAILDLRAWCAEKAYELEIVIVDPGSPGRLRMTRPASTSRSSTIESDGTQRSGI